MNIDFYYWGTQCPINEESIKLLERYKEKYKIEIYDITRDFKLAQQINMYFPFLTIINKKHRYHSPLRKAFLDSLLDDIDIIENPYVIETAEKQYVGEILSLTSNNIELISLGCTMSDCKEACRRKNQFLSEMGQSLYGYVNVKSGQILGGAEYVPSMQVPYKIPRGSDIAFITCVYHTSEKYDFKTAPIKSLEKYLKSKYKKVCAITDENGTFPNGNLKWFLKQGYHDKGLIYAHEGYCSLHLVEKDL